MEIYKTLSNVPPPFYWSFRLSSYFTLLVTKRYTQQTLAYSKGALHVYEKKGDERRNSDVSSAARGRQKLP